MIEAGHFAAFLALGATLAQTIFGLKGDRRWAGMAAVTGFGLMSSDSDFTPLVTRIRQEGIPVYGFGSDKTPQAFRSACTRFIDVGALIHPRETAGQVENDEPENSDAAADGAEVAPDLVKLLIDAYNAVKRDDQGFARLSEVGQLAGNRSSFDT
ncbi:NYN domain-containing protein, partial [Sphingomonas adhaesiva]|uniref:NYN domain-containing protein n=1 Tax=Sphingomonas adhaesiva TaxID=28212 RepID=UPI0035C67C61